MSIGKRNKNHLKQHAGVSAVGVEPPEPPKSDDPLYFWTNHPTDNYAIDLHSFAAGQFENPHPLGNNAGQWGGAYRGRSNLIAELAPAIQASVYLLAKASAIGYEFALRTWWRLFDAYEKTPLANGELPPRIESVTDINELHEAFAHQRGIHQSTFRKFRKLANAIRQSRRLPLLLCPPPKYATLMRTLTPDDQAKELKIAIKQDWERVRKTWARNDAIREEADRRERGESARILDEEDDRLLNNWQYFRRVQLKTGAILPNSSQLLDKNIRSAFSTKGLELKVMRSIFFPTAEEADIAFHLALMNSGWNPSTLINLDAESPWLVTPHSKDQAQLVLATDWFSESQDDEKATLQTAKRRAKGKIQFCTGLLKHKASPPYIVAAYLKRVAPLRELIKQQYAEAVKELGDMRNRQANAKIIEAQYLRTQKLRQRCSNVWLYVDVKGEVNQLDWRTWKRYKTRGEKHASYLDLLLKRLNTKRAERGKSAIAAVTCSDFRDIYARWVYKQSNGNILAVMLALGHSTITSTINYIENNLFSTENDAHALRFMTQLIGQLREGRIDLAILAQLVRNGALTPEMEARLKEYRALMKSRVGIGCSSPRHPPEHIAPNHTPGHLCGTNLCLKDCHNAKFLPESLNGIAMRVEELLIMLERLPRETFLLGGFNMELDSGEYLLETLYPTEAVCLAREKWNQRIASGEHIVPGLGHINQDKFEATT
ncbi:hypothetical protein [Chitinibacter tainanensis]|uniref:hypothetical protein n=1 Tax=Chitinibacter tainanensis TaxID=230667 RepID=UPI0023566554|nr:hypothetical protein [Chitinibacter tainanensis]